MLKPSLSRHVRLSLVPIMMFFWAVPTVSHGKGHQSDEKCTANKAQTLTIAEASQNRRSLEQVCVKLSGIIDGSTLYHDLDDVYRDTKVWRDHDPKLRMVSRIGLRPFPESVEVASSTSGVHRVTLIGRLHDCSRDWGTRETDDGEFVISMGSGWCHYNSGAVLTPISIVTQELIMVTRKSGRQEWRRFGDITPSKKDSVLAAEALTFLDLLIDAVHRTDRRVVLDLHGYSLIDIEPDGSNLAVSESESVAGSDAQSVLDLWFGNSGTILSQVHLKTERPNVRFFEPRWNTDDWPEIWACWGTGSFPEDRWPISSMDAVNVVGRPYACVKLVKERRSMGSSDTVTEVWTAQTLGGPTVLKEPAR